MTWFQFFETLQAHVCNWGNAYAEIQRDQAGLPIALWPLLPDRTRPERDAATRQIVYRTTVGAGQYVLLPASNVLHVAGLGFDGLLGYSVVRQARECIGLGLATEEYGARFFSNGVRPSGVLEVDGELSEVAYERLRKAAGAHQGLENAHRYMVLEAGAKWKQTSIAPEDAQFLETRQFGVTEICRWYRMQPHKVFELSRATFSNIEHQNIEHNVDTIAPWLRRWEQALDRRLVAPSERETYYVKFNQAGLLRGDIASRYKAYSIGRQWGWLCVDDIRELEEMNPLPNGQGQTFLAPLNMVPAGATQEDE
jgi:HK97 family phage portal protein